MRKVVVNSTPLIVLCGIGQLELLKRLYGEIYIPRAVYREVTAKKDSACVQIKNAVSWIHVIREVKPLLSEMKRKGFYVSNAVEWLVLDQAHE